MKKNQKWKWAPFRNKRIVEQVNKTRSWFFERINKIDKSLASLIKNKREKTLINKITNEKGEITTNTKEKQTILKTYYEKKKKLIMSSYTPIN